MYSTKLVNGLPSIQRDGRGILSVWGQDWEFAKWLCAVLNELNDDSHNLLLNEEDCQWLKAIDHAFGGEVQHA